EFLFAGGEAEKGPCVALVRFMPIWIGSGDKLVHTCSGSPHVQRDHCGCFVDEAGDIPGGLLFAMCLWRGGTQVLCAQSLRRIHTSILQRRSSGLHVVDTTADIADGGHAASVAKGDHDPA